MSLFAFKSEANKIEDKCNSHYQYGKCGQKVDYRTEMKIDLQFFKFISCYYKQIDSKSKLETYKFTGIHT